MASHDEHVLIDLIKEELWDAVTARFATEEGREELRRGGGLYGALPLHWACSPRLAYTPFTMLKAMLEQYPEAAGETDSRGWLPLHFACSGGIVCRRLVRLLLDTFPEGAKMPTKECIVGGNGHPTDISGQLPIHFAAYNQAELEVLKMLVDVHPEGTATRDEDGNLPIHHLAAGSHRYTIDVRIGFTPTFAHVLDDRLPLGQVYANFVEKAAMLLQPLLNNEEACNVSVPIESKRWTPLQIGDRFDLLNLDTCARMRHCPAQIMMNIARRHPEQLSRRDANDDFPLHTVSANPNINGAQVLCKRNELESSGNDGFDYRDGASLDESSETSDYDCFYESDGASFDENDEVSNSEGDDESSGGSWDESSEARTDSEVDLEGSGEKSDDGKIMKDFVSEFVKMYAEAAVSLNGNRRYPLNLAIESGKKWDEGVEGIADAAESVITIKDEMTGLYPFMLAATVDDPCICTVYSLLRRCPELKRYRIDR